MQPNQLTPGAREIRLQVDRLPQDTLIYGSIFLVSASLKRSITLSAKIQSLPDGAAAPAQGRIVWEPDNWSTLAIGYRKQLLEPDYLSGTPDSLPLPQQEVELPHSQTLAQPPRIKRDQKPPESSLFTTDEDGTKRTSSIPILRNKPPMHSAAASSACSCPEGLGSDRDTARYSHCASRIGECFLIAEPRHYKIRGFRTAR
ncbi:MAG: hypothetical protein EBE86_017760 [Hormoscilla sp. GUM202]|nr:hypothetical protein [Hormoscilla sp. GUM202]